MTTKTRQWVFVADMRGGRLLECSITSPNNRCRVEERDVLENTLLPNDQKGRPDPTGQPGVTYANPDHGHDVMRDQFAAEAANWLEQRMRQHEIESIDLFTPPEFLGALRRSCPSGLRARLHEHGADLRWMSTANLARHPAILQILGSSSGAARG